jgi:hypothetical protein
VRPGYYRADDASRIDALSYERVFDPGGRDDGRLGD